MNTHSDKQILTQGIKIKTKAKQYQTTNKKQEKTTHTIKQEKLNKIINQII